MTNSIYSRGTRSCTACDYIKANGKVQRTFDLHTGKWQFYRCCSWCGCCYPATVHDYNEQHPESPHAIAEALT